MAGHTAILIGNASDKLNGSVGEFCSFLPFPPFPLFPFVPDEANMFVEMGT